MFSSNTSQVSSDATFVEDVFSTYLYTGNASTLAINNGVDISGKGGLVWIKSRNTGARNNILVDTARGRSGVLRSNTTGAQATSSAGFDLVSFNSNGFTVGQPEQDYLNNGSSETYASWTFRKQAKFFDVVTYTGTGSNRTVAHNLGSTPGVIIIKQTSASGRGWITYHRSIGPTGYLDLSQTNATDTWSIVWNNTAPTSTEFTVGTFEGVNESGASYVAYIFAHNAGGFGLTGTDNVISCGSFTTDGSGNFSVNLGYEPQWVMIKSTNNTGVSAAQQNWIIMDTMRGLVTQSGNGARLRANTAEAEATANDFGPTATGFESKGNMSASAPFIYIAIRRGPMKTPTSGTSVFSPIARTGTGSDNQTVTGVGFPPDLSFTKDRDTSSYPFQWYDRLRGKALRLESNSTGAESNDGSYGVQIFGQNGITYGLSDTGYNAAGRAYINYFLLRAPSFFDEVCWYGDPATVTHNLNAVPELIIQKNRTTTQAWAVWRPGINYGFLNTTAAFTTYTGGSATSTTFTPIQTGSGTSNYVAYLFSTCAGVSKVGSYTGTGTTKQIDCGFTGGARFVLIKRTDSTGDWYVWDSARGIVSGNDPYLLLNSTAAEVTNTDYIDTYSAGFEISSTAPAAINANGGTFIFLAIA